MSEWTWSRYRADLIPKEKLNAWLDKEIKNLKEKDSQSYEDFYAWYNDKMRRYLLDIGLSESEIKKRSSKAEYSRLHDMYKKGIDMFSKIRAGEMNVQELAKWEDFMSNDMYGGDAYIDIAEIDDNGPVLFMNCDKEEIFRCSICHDEEVFTDVDSLIDFLCKQDGKNIIMDFSLPREKMVYGDLTPELAERIREHYGRYGDGNFIVDFG